MPRDLKSGNTLETVAVIDRIGTELPFSKGILATSILATGTETPRAYEIAHSVQDHLIRSRIQSIPLEELINLAAEKIAELLSPAHADRYVLWQKARQIGRPIVISLLGSSGVGKSTLATRLALRLGINRMVTTDSIREVLRTVIPASVLPELHVSSYEPIGTHADEDQASIYQRQARAVGSATAAVARRYVIENKDALFEGVHLLPGLLSQALESMEQKPIVVEYLLMLEDEDVHRKRLSHRQLSEPGRDGARNVKNFHVIRELQQTMQDMSRRSGVREFDVGCDEDLTQEIAKEIVKQAVDA